MTEKGSEWPVGHLSVTISRSGLFIFSSFCAKLLDFKVSAVLSPKNSELSKFFFPPPMTKLLFHTGANHHCTKLRLVFHRCFQHRG